VQQYYIPSGRELSRLVGVAKAPVIQHFAETISGTSTIRSFDQVSRFQQTNMNLMDGYSRPKFNIAGAMEWLSFRLDMLSSITFAFCLLFLISHYYKIYILHHRGFSFSFHTSYIVFICLFYRLEY
jgi:ATP-binding cassette, subfamily C (CFTR/MRP), member 2